MFFKLMLCNKSLYLFFVFGFHGDLLWIKVFGMNDVARHRLPNTSRWIMI